MLKISRRNLAISSLLSAPAPLLHRGSALAQLSETPPVAVSETEQIAIDAYVNGYSLITTEVTRVQMTQRVQTRRR